MPTLPSRPTPSFAISFIIISGLALVVIALNFLFQQDSESPSYPPPHADTARTNPLSRIPAQKVFTDADTLKDFKQYLHEQIRLANDTDYPSSMKSTARQAVSNLSQLIKVAELDFDASHDLEALRGALREALQKDNVKETAAHRGACYIILVYSKYEDTTQVMAKKIEQMMKEQIQWSNKIYAFGLGQPIDTGAGTMKNSLAQVWLPVPVPQ